MTSSQTFTSLHPPISQKSQDLLAASDVQWSRPVFKAPPLKVEPPVADLREFAAVHLNRSAR